MTWKPAEYTFTFKSYKQLVDNPGSIRYSKRGISSLVPKICDINGQICPFILRGKLILQKCWTFKKEEEENKTVMVSWDESLPPNIEDEFKDWIKEIPKISEQSNPRYIFQKKNWASSSIPFLLQHQGGNH